MSNEKKQVPIRQELFTWPSDRPELIGSKCKACGSVAFPKVSSCRNPDCESDAGVDEFLLGNKGKLDSFTVMYYQPPAPWQGLESMVPFGQGFVEMPCGIRVVSVLTSNEPKELKIGRNMEMVVEKFFEDEEGNDVMCYKFKPV
jgi:uncharacterized OB-fold protein